MENGTSNKQSSSVPVAKARPHWSSFAKIKIQDFITKNEKNIYIVLNTIKVKFNIFSKHNVGTARPPLAPMAWLHSPPLGSQAAYNTLNPVHAWEPNWNVTGSGWVD